MSSREKNDKPNQKKAIFFQNSTIDEHLENSILEPFRYFSIQFYYNIRQLPFIVGTIFPKCKTHELCYCKIHAFLFYLSSSVRKETSLRISKIQNDRLLFRYSQSQSAERMEFHKSLRYNHTCCSFSSSVFRYTTHCFQCYTQQCLIRITKRQISA